MPSHVRRKKLPVKERFRIYTRVCCETATQLYRIYIYIYVYNLQYSYINQTTNSLKHNNHL